MPKTSESPCVVLRLAEVKEATGLSRGTIYRKMREGSFPVAVRLGKRAIGWYAHEIEKFNRTRSRISVSHNVG